MGNIITPQSEQEKVLNEFIEYKNRLLYLVKKEAEKINCKRCSAHNWKVVTLHEVPSPIPSSIVLMCKHCKMSIPFATDRFGTVKQFSDMIQKELTNKGLDKEIETAANAQIKQFKDPNKLSEGIEFVPDKVKVNGIFKDTKKSKK